MSKTFPFTHGVVVLSNLMDQNGNLNSESASRLTQAVDVLRRTSNACLITTGWDYRADSEIRIAHAFRDAAVRVHDVDPAQIVTDTAARDTVGDAVFVKRNVVENSNIVDLTIVSSDYHMVRVREIFDFVFGPNYQLQFVGAPADSSDEVCSAERRSIEAFRNTFLGVPIGETERVYQRLIEAHPFYNGQVHPAVE